MYKKLAKNLIKQDYKRDLQLNWNKIKMDEKFFKKYYGRILEESRGGVGPGSHADLKSIKNNYYSNHGNAGQSATASELLDTLYTLKEDITELGIQSPVLIGQEMKILQVFGLYDKMWEIYKTSPVISLEGYNAILEYYLTLKLDTNHQTTDENHDFNSQPPPAISNTRPLTITKRKIWQVITFLKSNSLKPNMKTYCLLLDLFSTFYQDKKTCVDVMNKMSASGLEYSRECILSGVLAMARCDMDPSPRLDKLLYKYNDTLKLELGKDVEMMTALLKYWVVRKKPHACFKVFQKAVKCQTRLDVQGIKLILEAAGMTEDPYQLVIGSIVPCLDSMQSNPQSESANSSTLNSIVLNQEWIAVIKFLSQTGFPQPNSYGEGVSDEQIVLAKDTAKTIIKLAKKLPNLPLEINQIVYYAKGVLQLEPESTRKDDRQVLLESFMHGWMDAKGDIEGMEKAVTGIKLNSDNL